MVFEDGPGTSWIDDELGEEFDAIYKRAHTFDGYRYLGPNDWDRITAHMMNVRADWVAYRAENWSLEDLRAALFVEARAIHHEGYPPNKRIFIYMKDLDAQIATKMNIPLDSSDEYRERNLFAEGVWPKGKHPRYGLVLFDDQVNVLLREPRDHFGGYSWTFAKGKSWEGERPVETAVRAAA